MNTPPLFKIFTVFLRLGLTAFGGPAMVPHMRTTAVDKQGWLDDETFRLGMSVAQLIPGATAMQVAAYVGLRARGGLGGLAAYVGFGLPAFVLMLGLSVIYFSASGVSWVAAGFSGLQVVVIALILHAALDFALRYLDTLPSKLLATGAGIWFGLGGNPILALVLCCGLALVLLRGNDLPAPTTAAGPTSSMLSGVLFLIGLVLFLLATSVLSPALGELARLMAKVDCFAFGGGYVSLPIMLHEVVNVHGWLTQPQFMDGIGLGQVTPGPIVMTAAFVGYAVAGFAGATVASIAVFWPSLVFLSLAVPFADRLNRSPLARRLLAGSLICLVGLLAGTGMRFAVGIDWDIPRAVICLGSLAALLARVDVLRVVLAGAAVSVIVLGFL